MQNVKRQRPVDKMHIMRPTKTQTKLAIYTGPLIGAVQKASY